MNIDKIGINTNNIHSDSNGIKSADRDSAEFSGVLREIEIKTEIAMKCSKLPEPNVMVDPRAIARMAKDKGFYDKVMSKIDSFTSNQDISLNYPSITYSLVVDADGEWVETMVDEELKKKCEESSKKDKKTNPLEDLFCAPSQIDPQVDALGGKYSFVDYSNVLVDVKRRIQR